MNLTFVHCADRKFADTQMFGIHFMPVWAYTLASHLEAAVQQKRISDLDFQLFDARVDSLTEVKASDVFFFSGINQDINAILKLRQELKKRNPKALFVLGGPICWSYGKAGKIESLYDFDHLYVGDGENGAVKLIEDLQNNRPLEKVIQAGPRFDLDKALPMHRGLLGKTLHRYYGAVVEVSRGCPFLCEFCDIRTLPDNNRSHIKNPKVIVEELDYLTSLGAQQILFACDNFIGNAQWAEEVCDEIIAWRLKSKRAYTIYTWLTINLSRTPRLIKKLRQAGFDMFFIGVESFSHSSLLETAKVQNTTLSLVNAIREIQSYGFIVVAGLIFGFDSDPDNIVDVTLEGIRASGLISGDPSLLQALPGTPLYTRMRLSGRLRDAKLGLGGFKYQTNISYLKPKRQIMDDFKRFVDQFNRAEYQRKRLQSYISCLGENYIPPQLNSGYGNLAKLIQMSAKSPKSIFLLLKRFFVLLRSPARFRAIVQEWLYVARHSTVERPLWPYFKFWLFNWSNSLVKYNGLSDADFDIDTVKSDFDYKNLVPLHYEDTSNEDVEDVKSKSQRRFTTEALNKMSKTRDQ